MKKFALHAAALAGVLCICLPASAQTGSPQDNTGEARIASNGIQPAEVRSIDVQFPQRVRRMGRAVGPLRTVTLSIEVRADGKAGDIDIAKSSGFDPYDKEARSAARDATYAPAMSNGKPVDSRLSYDVSFGLLCNRAAGNHSCDHQKYPETCTATVCDTLLR